MKLAKRFFCFTLVVVMMLCNSITAFADDTDSSSDMNIIPVEESDISKEEAIEILGLTKSEAEGKQIYLSVSPNSTNQSINPGGDPFDSGFFSFSGTNIGRYYTMNGDVLAYSILWKPTEDLGYGVPAIEVRLYPYGGSCISSWYTTSDVTTLEKINGYFRSPTMAVRIQEGLDYHFIYHSYHAFYDGYMSKDSACSLRLIMVVS